MEPDAAAFSPSNPPVIAKPSPWRQVVAVILSLCLGLFLLDGIISLADSALALAFNLHFLSAFRAMTSWFCVISLVAVYGLIGITPLVPKRVFLPLTLFAPVSILLCIPLLIFHYNRMLWCDCLFSVLQIVMGVAAVGWIHRGFRVRLPLVPASCLGKRGFSWRNLILFIAINVFVFIPIVFFYLACCAGMAMDHFSDGFLKLRPRGLIVQSRKYVNDGGKTIVLFPMSHIGNAEFYSGIAQAVPSNSIVLMEGVTDHRHLLTNSISYKRVARSLGLAEQHEEFDPARGEVLPADVDVEVFAPTTIDVLNLAMLVHKNGLNAGTVLMLMRFSPPQDVQEQLLTDLLRKRNRHLLDEVHSHLADSDTIIIPWGVAHMPEVAREIENSGFRLKESHDYVTIRFGSAPKTGRDAGKGGKPDKTN
jgi:hypothetical protein